MNDCAVEKSKASEFVKFGIGNHPETKVGSGVKVCVTREVGIIVGVLSGCGVSVSSEFESGIDVAELMVSDGIGIVD